MNILLILKESTMHEQLGVMYLSSVLKSRGYTVKLVLAKPLGFTGLKKIFHNTPPNSRIFCYDRRTY